MDRGTLRVMLLSAMLLVACSSAGPLLSAPGPSASASPTSDASVSEPTAAPSVDPALLESHEAACQEVDAGYVAAGGTSALDGANRLLVLQTFGRPIHMYSDGTWLILCVARAGVEPRLDRYRLAELAATRLEQAALGNLPPLQLVTPLAGIQEDQFGAFVVSFGAVDPIVNSVTFTVPGPGEVGGVVGTGPILQIGEAETDVYFLAQWPGDQNYESWTAYDSCGAVLGNITAEGAPTPCPPVR